MFLTYTGKYTINPYIFYCYFFFLIFSTHIHSHSIHLSSSISDVALENYFAKTYLNLGMDSHANLCCILKVHSRCDACKFKALEVLSSIIGVYDVTIDAETKMAKIMGEVNPNRCIKALARCGQHAELVWAKVNHPRLNKMSGPYDYNCYDNYNDHYGYQPCYNSHQRSLPEGMWREGSLRYPVRNVMPLPEYSYHPNYHYDHGPMEYNPYHRHPMEYNPYLDHESMNYFNIM